MRPLISGFSLSVTITSSPEWTHWLYYCLLFHFEHPRALDALKKVILRETSAGYRNLAERVTNCLKSVMNAPRKSQDKLLTSNGDSEACTACGCPGPTTHSGSTSREMAGSFRGAFRGRARGAGAGARSRSFHPYRRW